MVGTTTTAVRGEPAASLLATLGLPLDVRAVASASRSSTPESIPSDDIRPRAFFDFTPAAGVQPYDDYGHGTHVSGLIASRGLLSQTSAGARYPGIAPKVSLIGLKVHRRERRRAHEHGARGDRVRGREPPRARHRRPQHLARPSDSSQASIGSARAGRGSRIARGHHRRRRRGQRRTTLDGGLPGYAGILSPGNARSAITVGAVDAQDTASRRDDAVASYSSRGPTWYDARPKPDLVAPGHNLVSDAAAGSTLVFARPDLLVTANGSHAQFLRLSGTSQATAVTTGISALVIEAMRGAGVPVSPALVKAILSYTAIPLPGYDGLTQGHGEVNAAGAIALARALGGGRPSAPVTVIAGDAWRWSQHRRFPRALVHGNGTDPPAWSQTIVWGTSHDGDTIVWGTNAGHDGDTIVWGTTGDGDTIVWGTTTDGDTIVWGTIADGDTIVWGTTINGNMIVWGTASGRGGPAPPSPLLRGPR